ncbi:cyclopropane-fatty-acyl-phospholipid synthase family protein [Immundisolibacter sp.]|uniref:SAM-dependent methyltransferase n=1 Tax=Immundisolibacter sp. TaxID=1934948 RepID=UPI00263408BC|nr:cyclopropane-fatty-acyl-phospholipid synthase family protein [Immundisolibacter sp.]MDD3650575.1 cyclopropane-fatty-acyl-phospholipid synthase [Immundisolibacter sp.]
MQRELAMLARLVRQGTLELELPGGEVHRFGSGAPLARWRFARPAALRRIAANPELALGETYMRGDWDAPPGELAALLTVLLRNAGEFVQRAGRLRRLLAAALQQWNRVQVSYRNASHHYDLDEWLFRRFLDRDMYYSCAYFTAPDVGLEDAQRAKAEHIAAKLCLQPGQRVLDIGSGWGSLALHLAQHHGVEVTGLTLSRRQLEAAQRAARERGLAERVRFLLQDYREHQGQYDRIVSVGMFEHVGRPFYARFFGQVAACLRPGGVALLHTICRLGPPGTTNAWVRKYIFPGGYSPALSELADGIEHSALKVTDVELLRRHYALTLRAWQARFQQHRAEVAERLGETFCRMWEFYLAASEASFEVGDLGVAQVQLATHIDAVPLTRDYLYRQRSAPQALRRAG